jgi:hypothetical protein
VVCALLPFKRSSIPFDTSSSAVGGGVEHPCINPESRDENEVDGDTVDCGGATPVLTRSSILRTSSQRLDAWDISPKHKPVDRKDSVRFKLSLPRRTDDVPYDA